MADDPSAVTQDLFRLVQYYAWKIYKQRVERLIGSDGKPQLIMGFMAAGTLQGGCMVFDPLRQVAILADWYMPYQQVPGNQGNLNVPVVLQYPITAPKGKVWTTVSYFGGKLVDDPGFVPPEPPDDAVVPFTGADAKTLAKLAEKL